MSHKKPALCLDLDGTVRYSKENPQGFIKGPEDINIFDGVVERIRAYKEKGYLIFGITNQGGVAFGFKSIHQVREENSKTCELCENLFNIVDGSPSHEEGSEPAYAFRSLLRKPNYGVLAWLERYYLENFETIIDWDKSLFVGDRPEDEQCAKSAEIDFMWAKDWRES